MKSNRIVFLAAAFLVLGSGLMLSRVWSGGQPLSTEQHEDDGKPRRSEMGKPENQPDNVIAAAVGPVILGSAPIRVTFKASQAGESLRARLRSLAANRGIYLIVGNLSAVRQPGVAYHIFFDLPPDAQPDLHSPHYAGTINFYDSVKLEGADPNSKDQRAFSFDITYVVRSRHSSKLSDDPVVTIRPGGAPAAGSQAQIGRLELVAE